MEPDRGIFAEKLPMTAVFFQRFGSTFFLLKVWLDTVSRFLVTVIIFRHLDTKSVNCHRDRTVAILVTADVFGV